MDKRPMPIGIACALLNAVFWPGWVLVTPRLPAAYFAERDARVQVTEHGVNVTLIADVDPMPILVERPLAYPLERPPALVRGALLANFPGVMAGALTAASLDASLLSSRTAAWAGTLVFAMVSTAQWVLFGYLLARFRARRALGKTH